MQPIMCTNASSAFYQDAPWRGAGVAVPVFSIRSDEDLGVGEFLDLKLLVDWAVNSGFHLVQLLPINDTSVNGMWWDSYPYRYGYIQYQRFLFIMVIFLEYIRTISKPRNAPRVYWQLTLCICVAPLVPESTSTFRCDSSRCQGIHSFCFHIYSLYVLAVLCFHFIND